MFLIFMVFRIKKLDKFWTIVKSFQDWSEYCKDDLELIGFGDILVFEMAKGLKLS